MTLSSAKRRGHQLELNLADVVIDECFIEKGRPGCPGANQSMNKQSGQWGYLRVLPVGDSRIQALGTQGMVAKCAGVQPEPHAIPTAMK